MEVKEGDAVEAGQPLAQEWAASRCEGVPRFQAQRVIKSDEYRQEVVLCILMLCRNHRDLLLRTSGTTESLKAKSADRALATDSAGFALITHRL